MKMKEFAILGVVVMIGSLAAMYVHDKFIAHTITKA